MLTEQPLVSVLMTVYNREHFIREAIESVLASTYTNFELIISDDRSTDQSVAVAREYEARDTRIRVYQNEKNLGDYPNRNKAANLANGEYIIYVDSDDKINTDGIERCIKAMLAYPDSSFGMYWPFSKQEAFVLTSEEAINQHFFKNPFLTIGPGGTIIRKSFFEKINGYPEKYGPANDMYFNLKAASQTPIVLMPFEFMYYRRHEGQEINNSFGYLYNGYNYVQDAMKELKLPLSDKRKKWVIKKSKRRFLLNLVNYYFTSFNFKKTMEARKKSGYTIRNVFEAIFQI